jgi:hypothetical protein
VTKGGGPKGKGGNDPAKGQKDRSNGLAEDCKHPTIFNTYTCIGYYANRGKPKEKCNPMYTWHGC